jgi:hypothetical protein
MIKSPTDSYIYFRVIEKEASFHTKGAGFSFLVGLGAWGTCVIGGSGSSGTRVRMTFGSGFGFALDFLGYFFGTHPDAFFFAQYSFWYANFSALWA